MLFGSVFQASAAHTVNDRAPHEVLYLCSVNSSLFAERILTATPHYLKINICPMLVAESFVIALDSTNVVCRSVGVSWE